MKYTSVSNPAWANPDQTAIDCFVGFEGLGVLPYTASPQDSAKHCQEIFSRAVSGEFGPVADYAPPPPAPAPAELPPPPPPTKTTPLAYIERFTDAEQLAIVTAAMSAPALRLWYDKLMAAQEVVFADPRLSAGMDALVAYGLITQARSEAVLPLNLRSSGVQEL